VLIKVNFTDVSGGVLAVVEGMPSLQGRGATQSDALANVLRLVEAHYKAKAVPVQSVVEVATEIEEPQAGPLPNEQLRALAKTHRPPQSWYEETEPVL